MAASLERTGDLPAGRVSEAGKELDMNVVSGVIDKVYGEAYKFIIGNELRINLGVSAYNQDSQLQLTRIIKNGVAVHLLKARANKESGLVGRIKKRFSSAQRQKLETAAEILVSKNRDIFESPNGPTDHFLGAADSAINSLFKDLDPETAGSLDEHTQIDPDKLKSWGDHWRPLISELGVGRRS